jgi:hypothetical protein
VTAAVGQTVVVAMAAVRSAEAVVKVVRLAAVAVRVARSVEAILEGQLNPLDPIATLAAQLASFARPIAAAVRLASNSVVPAIVHARNQIVARSMTNAALDSADHWTKALALTNRGARMRSKFETFYNCETMTPAARPAIDVSRRTADQSAAVLRTSVAPISRGASKGRLVKIGIATAM